MSNGTHQREVIDFLKDHGATAIGFSAGGKHQRLDFEFRGIRRSYTISGTPSDYRSSANAIAELKRMLGNAIENPEPEPRRLEDMLPEAPDRPSFPGRMAFYVQYYPIALPRYRLRFIFPHAIVEQQKLGPGQPFEVALIGTDTWHLRRIVPVPTGAKSPNTRFDSRQLILDVVSPEAFGQHTEPFGVSPADYSIVGEAIVAHLHNDQLTRVRGPGPKNKLLRPPQPPAAAPVPAEPSEEELDVSVRLRVLLAAISAAERQTGYRLVKVRATPDAEPVWLWRAPDIRL